MRIAMLSPISWRTPPRHYGPWESVVSLLTEQLVSMGVDVTLFATRDSLTSARLEGVCEKGYSEDSSINPKVWECLHIASVFEKAGQFDLIHNHFDFLPLTYCGLVETPMITTIHGFSSAAILPVYRKYNHRGHYVAISDADKHPDLEYAATIHHGINLNTFRFSQKPGDYLLFFGRIHHDKGVREAIEVARAAGKKLVIAGIVQDREYFEKQVEPYIDGIHVEYLGSVSGDTKTRVLGGAAGLLHLINFDEPFGLSMVEAMACGTPVIAIDRGSIPEIIDHGRTGFIVRDIDDARSKVGRLAELNRETCRRHVESRFDVNIMASKYYDLYRNIVEN